MPSPPVSAIRQLIAALRLIVLRGYHTPRVRVRVEFRLIRVRVKVRVGVRD